MWRQEEASSQVADWSVYNKVTASMSVCCTQIMAMQAAVTWLICIMRTASLTNDLAAGCRSSDAAVSLSFLQPDH